MAEKSAGLPSADDARRADMISLIIDVRSAALKKNTKVADQIRVVEGPPETANHGTLAQAELHRFIDHLRLGLAGIDNAVRATYFA